MGPGCEQFGEVLEHPRGKREVGLDGLGIWGNYQYTYGGPVWGAVGVKRSNTVNGVVHKGCIDE